jgi:hypothetical protein
MARKAATILAVHEGSNGYWYIGAGRSIAEGPYRYPQQLLTVASDLLAQVQDWRIEVFDRSGAELMRYSSDEIDVSQLRLLRGRGEWTAIAQGTRH